MNPYRINPHRFGWSGSLALLCLAVILLPATTTRAQDKADVKKADDKKPEEKKGQIRFYIEGPDTKLAEQQAELRAKLKALEAELELKKAEAEKLTQAMKKLQENAEEKLRAEARRKSEAETQRRLAEEAVQQARAAQDALKLQMEAQAKALEEQARAAQKREYAARITAAQKEAEAKAGAKKEEDQDPRAREIKEIQAKLDALIREKERLAKAAPTPAKSTVSARRILVLSVVDKSGKVEAGHVVMLEKDGKEILQVPAEMIIAERNGKLILEIPLAATDTKKATLIPDNPAPKVIGTFMLDDVKGLSTTDGSGKITLQDGTVRVIQSAPAGIEVRSIKLAESTTPADRKTQVEPLAEAKYRVMQDFKVEDSNTTRKAVIQLKPGSPEERIANLEKRLAEVLKELEGLRKEMKEKESKGKPAGVTISADGKFIRVEQDAFVVPLPTKPGAAPKDPAAPIRP